MQIVKGLIAVSHIRNEFCPPLLWEYTLLMFDFPLFDIEGPSRKP